MMHAFVLKVEKKFKKIEYTFAIIAGFIIVFLMFLVTADVIMRNFFNKPMPGVYELVGFFFVGAVFLGFPYVQGEKENIKIDIATNSLSDVYKRILDFSGYLIGLLIIGIIFWQSGIEALNSFKNNDYSIGIVRFPLWPAKLSVAVGTFFLSLRLILDMLLLLFRWKDK